MKLLQAPFVASALALFLAVALAGLAGLLQARLVADGASIAGAYLLAQCAAVVAAAAFLALFHRRLPPTPQRAVYGLSIGFLIATAAVLTAFMLAAGAGEVKISPAASAPTVSALGVWLIGWLIHAFVEEALFRGVAQPALAARFGPLAGVIGGALLWTWLQAAQGYAQPIQLAISFLVGFGCGALALRYGLAAAVGAHAGWGYVELVVLRGETGLADWRFTTAVDTADAPTFLIVVAALTAASLTPFLSHFHRTFVRWNWLRTSN